MAKHKAKNPKARKEAAKRLLAMSMKRKMSKGAVAGNGTADKDRVPQDGLNMDSGNPGLDMK